MFRDEILEGTLLPEMNRRLGVGVEFRFAQDNSPIHTARVCRQWFEEHPHIRCIRWPSNSPDLNFIENIFGLMKMEWDPRFERREDLLEAHCREVWATFNRRPQIWQRLAASVPRRIQAVIAANGGHTKY